MLLATGGRLEIVWVTNRNASGAGSLKAACEGGSSNVTRIVLFAVNGVIDLGNKATHSGTQYKNTIRINRSNLWVAGQSCPPADGANGRGIKVLGRFLLRRSRVVIQHVRVHPIYGDNDPRQSIDEGEGLKHASGNIDNTTHRRIVWQNCSVHAATDETLQIDTKLENNSFIRNTVLADCFFTGARHYATAEYLYHGGNPNTLALAGGSGGYGPMMMGCDETLFLRNIVASATFRSPQLGSYWKGLLVNNYIFNFGHHYDDAEGAPGERKLCPISSDFGTKASWVVPPQPYALIGYQGNYAEGGCRSNPWRWDGEFLRVRSIHASRVRWWDGGDNYVTTYYQRAGLLEFKGTGGGNRLVAKNDLLTDVKQEEWGYPQTRPQYGTQLGSPPYSLPTSVLPAFAVPATTMAHAGAWPVDRDSVDEVMLQEIDAKTHDIYPGIPMQSGRYAPANIPDLGAGAASYPLGSGQSPTYDDGIGYPADPDAIEANGLHAIENWLHARHVAAGGYPDYAVQEWFARG